MHCNEKMNFLGAALCLLPVGSPASREVAPSSSWWRLWTCSPYAKALVSSRRSPTSSWTPCIKNHNKRFFLTVYSVQLPIIIIPDNKTVPLTMLKDYTNNLSFYVKSRSLKQLLLYYYINSTSQIHPVNYIVDGNFQLIIHI